MRRHLETDIPANGGYTKYCHQPKNVSAFLLLFLFCLFFYNFDYIQNDQNTEYQYVCRSILVSDTILL